jgi:hypothetical protein
MDVEDLHFDQDHIPPAGEEPNETALPERRIPVSHVYHPKLNGMSSIFINRISNSVNDCYI